MFSPQAFNKQKLRAVYAQGQAVLLLPLVAQAYCAKSIAG
jgi:hypothetical protein